MDSSEKYQRYQRQILLKEMGMDGQEKLQKAKILVVGAGGLGCPALQYLAAAGVGTIGIADFDIVELSNLQRQPLYSYEDIGKSKAFTAANRLKSLNADIVVQSFNIRLQPDNALDIISNFDLVIDGTDNFSSRYLINDACVLLDKPLLYGAVLRFEGHVGVFNLADVHTKIKTNYRNLFPEPPDPASTLSCTEAGVLGVLPGIIGTLQATEAIKIITGIGTPLCNTIVSYNALSNTFYEFTIPFSDKVDAAIPENITEFLNYDYDWFCGMPRNTFELSVTEFDEMREKEKILIIDVREKGELPAVNEFENIHIPLSSFEKSVSIFTGNDKVVFFCQSGIRSVKAARLLQEKNIGCHSYSLKDGIIEWKKQHLDFRVK